MNRPAAERRLLREVTAPLVIRKIRRRILPFIFLLYVVAYLDRANVAFTKLTMMPDLGFSEAVYGLGAGLFFVGYFLLEIPGALIVEKYGARRWMARILITWGCCSMLTAFVRTPGQFFGARFLLGAAEAGFFPGIIVYLSHWFPYPHRARAMAGFVLAIPLSISAGAPVSGWILSARWLGLAGWQWVFILEGIPSVILGFVTLVYLTDWPREAEWLEPGEREWITAELEKEKAAKMAQARIRVGQALRQRNVLVLAAILCLANIGATGYLFWLPSTIQRASMLSPRVASALSALPFVLAMMVLVMAGRSSDRSGERLLHTAVPLFLGGTLFALTAVPGQPFWRLFLTLCLTGGAAYAWTPSYWVLPTLTLTETAAAAAIGLINSIGNLGGFIGPATVGFILANYQAPWAAALIVSAAFVLAGALLFALRGIPGGVAGPRRAHNTAVALNRKSP